jgi:cytidine deaminase
MEYRAKSRTFRSSVGVAFEAQNNWFGGFNIEKYAYNGYHAEEVAIIRGLDRGFRGTDFTRMVEIFQDAGHNEVEIFPACPLYCWGVMNAFTHPGLQVIVADVDGNVHYQTTLKEIIHPPAPGTVYPSDKIRAIKPLCNVTPLGNTQPAAPNEKMSSPGDVESIIHVALEYQNKCMVFAKTEQVVYDSVSLGMADGEIFGGFRIHTHHYKGYRPEEVAGIIALSQGYNGPDFKIMAGVIPDYVNASKAKAFMSSTLESWAVLLDFGNPDIKVIGIDKEGSVLHEGSIKDMFRSFEKDGSFIDDLKSTKRRLASEPKATALTKSRV